MAPSTDPADASEADLAQRGRRLDVVGVVVVLGTATWALVSASGRPDTRPWSVVALALASLILAACARRARPGRLVAGVIALATAGALVLGFPDVLGAGGGPTGYANANADLAALGAIAASAAAALSGSLHERRAWMALAAGLALAVGATGSVVASCILLVVAVCTLTSVVRRDVAASLLGGLIVTSMALGATVAISHGSEVAGLRQRDELRAELWTSAAVVAADQPMRGVGPGRYETLGLVSTDADLRWAHHGYLQVAAEMGLVGLALLLGLVAWAYARLWSGRRRGSARTLAGAAALTVVAAHASFDHVLHRPAVPLMLAVLVGWATADRPDPDTPG